MLHFWEIFVPLISAGVFMLPRCVQLLEFCFKSVQFLPLKEYFSERNINRRNVFPYRIMLRKHKCSESNHNYFAVSILRTIINHYACTCAVSINCTLTHISRFYICPMSSYFYLHSVTKNIFY